MSDYTEFVAPNRRRIIIETLNSDPDYSHNDAVLRSWLIKMGHKVSADVLRSDLAWLEEQGLITTSRMVGVWVARLTERGVDAATGAVVIPGIERQRPQR
ncbi:hypothetical protein [uncultured Desulfuromonas sp.]|uniref:VpaChn25_0724 family phage protein n=1 Tax=uncultured Desulfuromonas sp. TaxID=181013 RepID=UPI002AABFA66|nr:hypothetical protein [uncultured Desulfuromonas sp.]